MMMAAAGAVRSERWNVITLIPLARQSESSSCPNVPCERRTDPAKPPGTNPRRQLLSATFQNPRKVAGLKSAVLPDPWIRFLSQ